MDKTNNLQYFLTDIADAIREKNGTTDLINAQDFADEIRNVPTEGEGSSAEANDLFYYMINTADNPEFYIDLKTGELVKATSWFEDEEFRNGYYSIDGDTISVRHPGGTFYYGIGTVTSIVVEGEESEAFSGFTIPVSSYATELLFTKIGNWNFKLLLW